VCIRDRNCTNYTYSTRDCTGTGDTGDTGGTGDTGDTGYRVKKLKQEGAQGVHRAMGVHKKQRH
jgi:hypothetical protein